MSAKLRLIICNERVEQKKEYPAVILTVPQLPEAAGEPEEPQPKTAIPPKVGNKMLPASVGLVLAVVFRLMAHAVYGTMGLLDEAWVDAVFWAIIAIGVVVSLLQFQSDSVP